MSRFIAHHGSRGSVCIRDTTRSNRMVCTFDRDWQAYGGDKARADAAAKRMAEICAAALNQAHEKQQAKRQEGGE